MDGEAELLEVARILGTRVRRQELRHPAVDEPFSSISRFDRGGRRLSWSASRAWFLLAIEAPSGIVFAAGQPDLVLQVRSLIGAIDGASVFESAVLQDASPRSWLRQVAHQRLLAALALRGTEQLLVAANRTSLIFPPEGVEGDLLRLERLELFVDALPSVEPDRGGRTRSEERHAQLPSELRPLVQLSRRWAIDDDVDRALAIEAASEQELAELWSIVGPTLHAIDELIDTSEGCADELATTFGSLAQAALEAHAELTRRRPT